ncbi:MAG: hypothetical protein SVU32_05265 [Candidatus Nanohaloarchaea archaeon]|nr:hypothetical protein [Candidatus Nanohaloarchaea archaeon]
MIASHNRSTDYATPETGADTEYHDANPGPDSRGSDQYTDYGHVEPEVVDVYRDMIQDEIVDEPQKEFLEERINDLLSP